ncbi:MAG: homoserine dehydrogenase [Nitrospirota bacterium]|nr:homoserine dehydrogenase [Nitrospirota bacterium]
MSSAVNIGIIGAGTVGGGTASILLENADVIRRRTGFPVHLARVAEKDAKRLASLKLPKGVGTSDAAALIADPGVDIVVELVGGTGVARDFTLAAFAAGKHVVTANKALIAAHGEELFAAAASAGVQYRFEAAVGGGIPILRSLREGFTGDRILSLFGIINGTANYILTEMTDNGSSFDEVLAEAQKLGYAEADPTYDVEGIDTAHKLAILISLSFGGQVDVDDIYTEGITRVSPVDLAYAEAFGCKVKLLAIAKEVEGEIEARVHPTMVPDNQLIAQVDGVFNAVAVTGDRVGETLFYGRGAGAQATGSAVVGDIVDLARRVHGGKATQVPPMGFQQGERRPLVIRPMARIESLYYLHLRVVDRPGVLADIAGVFGRHRISIARVIQDSQASGKTVSLVVMTHRAVEQSVQDALQEIEKLDCVADPATLIRVEAEDV